MTYRTLVIEDNRDIAHLLELHLRDLSHEVHLAFDGTSGLARAQGGRYDIIILDLMLPGLDGLELCRRLRATSDHTPILMLTARSSEIDRVLGLELGADDYLTKPFSIQELLARVKAILRRIELAHSELAQPDGAPIRTDTLEIDPERRNVRVRGNSVELTAREFDLLVHFARYPGRVYSRAQLLDQVWGYGYEGYEHTVNSHINRLRAKIERDPAHPELIRTVWGVGYQFNDISDSGPQ
jgi:DNA-binding response OmpR family regulator